MIDNAPIAAPPPPRNTLALLRRFARPRPVHERCELCATILGAEHQHLLEPATRELHCACEACAILFSNTQNGTYRRVPRRIERWTDFHITDEQWAALGIPISLAFFSFNTQQQQIVAMYPSPGGATASTLAGEVWQLLSDDNPCLAELEPDVEALLVNRTQDARQYFRVPIDECYKLVGLIRTHWRGLYGGAQVWREIDLYFQHLAARSVGAPAHA